jgi:hypothetical protein
MTARELSVNRPFIVGRRKKPVTAQYITVFKDRYNTQERSEYVYIVLTNGHKLNLAPDTLVFYFEPHDQTNRS